MFGLFSELTGYYFLHLTAEVKPDDQKPVPGKASHIIAISRAPMNKFWNHPRNILNTVISMSTFS